MSKFWANDEGFIHRITPSGRASKGTPANFGVFTDGHNILFDSPSPWEETFEGMFDRPDNRFPELIENLNAAAAQHRENSALTPLDMPHEFDEVTLTGLLECVLSLLIRSPRFRYMVVKYVERLRGAIPSREKKRLAAVNIRASFARLARELSPRGKFMVLFSHSEEFIFGDGFYSNITPSTENLMNARILTPLTPNLCLFYLRPLRYRPNPQVITRRADSELVALVNESVQVYARDWVFFRRDQRIPSKHFLASEYLRYGDEDPVLDLANTFPGVDA